MKFFVRSTRILGRLMLCAAWAAAVGAAAAADYPQRPIRWIVPFAAGGPTDVVVRIVASASGEALNGHKPLIDNKPGGATVIGTQALNAAVPDGYTIGSVTDNLSINELLLAKVPYRFNDFEFVSGLIKMPMVLAVRSDLPVSGLDSTLGYLTENASKLSYGTWGAGSGAHLAAERLADLMGVNFVHVPYPGSAPAMNALLARQIDFVILDLASVLPHALAGKAKIVAVTSAERTPVMADTPSLAERFKGFDAFAWNGVAAPRGTPAAVVEKLKTTLHQVLRHPEIVRNLNERGMTVWAADPAALKRRLEDDHRDAKAIILKRNIRLE